MSNVALEDLGDRIRPFVRQCPTDLITQALIEIMRDFYFHTRAYQYEDNDTIAPLTSDYDLNLPNTSTEEIAIEAMTIDGTPCYPKSAQWLTEHVDANWRSRDADDFRYFTQLKPGTFTFPCVPTKIGTVNGIFYRVSLRPTIAATVIDSEQSNRWIDTWSPGVLWKLKSMGGTPPPVWYDPKGAAEKFTEYRSMRGAARIEVAKNYTNASDAFGNRGRRFA